MASGNEVEGQDIKVTQALFYSALSHFQQKVAKQTFDELPLATAKVVLDLGCGPGDVTVALATHLSEDSQVIAVDPNKERIELARDKYGCNSNIKFEIGSDSNFPNMGKEFYDLIFSNFVFHWIADRPSALRILYDSLIPGGTLALVYCCSDHFDVSRCVFHKWLDSVLPAEQRAALYKVNRTCELRPGVAVRVVETECRNAGFTVLSSTTKTIFTTYASVESLAKYLYGGSDGVVDIRPLVQDIECNNPPPRNDMGEVLRDIFYTILIAKK